METDDTPTEMAAETELLRARAAEGPRPQQVPSIGRMVHYVAYGTPGGEYLPEHRAATITEVWAHCDNASLCVI